MSTHIGEPNDSYSEQIPLDERRYTRLGWLALGVGVFGFLAGGVCTFGQRGRVSGIGNRFRQP